MSDARYVIELAKSARAKCAKCKQAIAKDVMRIGAKSHNGDYEVVKWHHLSCFKLPRKYSTGSGKMSVEDFCRDVLEDESGSDILSGKMDEVIEQIEGANDTTTTAKGGKAKTSGGKGGISSGPLAELKAAYELEQQELGDGKEPSSKKTKSSLAAKLDAYSRYKDAKNDELQDMLKYNHQIQKGNKDFMLAKVIDGCVYGRLSRCELCGGVLKMMEDGKTIECGGSFDEASQRRIPCSFTCLAEDAPRWQPWYESEPNEEEQAAMEKQIEEYKEAGGAPAGGSTKEARDEQVQAILKAATAAKVDWDMTDKSAMKRSVTELAKVLLEGKGFPKLDLPSDQKQAQQKVGELVLSSSSHRDKTLEEFIPIVIQEFGLVQEKATRAAKREAAVASSIQCPANAPIVAALEELSNLYFKEGNFNSGSTYKKAVAAIGALDYEITANNAKGLGKGTTKVQNIGKGTADKIYEFVTTGTIEKLEEKRGS